MTKLVIVESPGKINKIKSFLGPEYNVMASVGHIRDLSKDSLSIDVNDNYKPTYSIMDEKKSVVNNLIKASKNADEVYLAADGDREGEAIAYHLAEVLNLKNSKRIIFNEITKNTILKSLSNPTKIDMNMFYAQQARRLLDRIVGYKLSPILKSIPDIKSKSLGAGRVQSVVTRMIVDREQEITNFINNKIDHHYNITGNFTINNISFHGSYIHNKLIKDYGYIKELKPYHDELEYNQYKFINNDVSSKRDVKIIALSIKYNPKFEIIEVEDKKRYRHPGIPFTTSTLQQESSYKLKFNLKKTMSLAQKLYEKGLITYMRTDSPNLSNDALNYIKKEILEDKGLGETYYQYRQFKSKNALCQEAHEAIRPTHFNIYDLSEYKMDNTDEEKLYQLIWKRTVASQIKSAEYHDQHIILSNLYQNFEGTNSLLVFDGYLKLYNDVEENEESEHLKINDQNLKENTVILENVNFKETYKNPPSRYNEASLVKKLEEYGIGRPSTYASIISKIQEHKYIYIGNSEGIDKTIMTYTLNKDGDFLVKQTIQKIGNDKCRLLPTDDGKIITNYLVNNFNEIMDYKFTADLETKLDDIAEGKCIWYNVLDDFYKILSQEFKDLNLDINNLNPIKVNIDDPERLIIGNHPKHGEIIYMKTKYGYALKVQIKKSRSYLFSSIGYGDNKVVPGELDALSKSIQLVDQSYKKLMDKKNKNNNNNKKRR